MLAPLTGSSARALLSPSARVLVAAARGDGGAADVGRLPWAEVHWPTLLALTGWERAESQLSRLMRSAPTTAIPEPVRQSVERMARVAAFRAGGLATAAGIAADALAAAGVPAMWLKGAALAMQSEEGFDVRTMGDLDILVEPSAMPAARAALCAAGWAVSPEVDPALYVGHHHDAPLLWQEGQRLELHGALFPAGHPFRAATTAEWLSRSVPASWSGRTVRVLPPHWHAVHASVHWAWSHEGEVGSWQYLRDLAQIASELDWKAVATSADEVGASRPLGWALWSGRVLVEAPVPDATVAALRGQVTGVMGSVCEREWITRSFRSPSASPSVAWTRYWWRRAMGGLGRAEGAWPWVLGDVTGAGRGPENREGTTPGDGPGKLRRWQRHLGQLLQG